MLGILFLVNPLVSAGALAWFIGTFIVFGVFEVAARSKCATWARRCGAGCCSRASSGRCAA
ncbi:MAG: hypothetical protein ACLTMP_10320 [Eggerthella lenta]